MVTKQVRKVWADWLTSALFIHIKVAIELEIFSFRFILKSKYYNFYETFVF